jgi:LytS/YehU family sensor histidine kinase
VLVENSGHWVSEKDPSSTGIGLSNLGQRLQLICGPLATVNVKSPPDRVILQVILPEEYLLSSKL